MGEQPANIDAGLRAVLETALDPVIIMDPEGNVTGWNEKAELTFGWTREEALGRALGDLIIPLQYRDAHAQGLRHYLQTGEGPALNRRIELTAVNREGRELPVELSVTFTESFGERLFIGFVRDITERKNRAERQERLMRELSHRVKNMLALVAAIATQTARSAKGIKEFQNAFLGRLQSLARGHDLLVSNQGERTSLMSLAHALLEADVAQGRAEIGGPVVLLNARQVMGLSMVVHELYTNASKYGAFAGPNGRVALLWTLSDDQSQVELVWKETDLNRVREPRRSGFGQKMISSSVRHDLHGSLESAWLPEGLLLKIQFPLHEQADEQGMV